MAVRIIRRKQTQRKIRAAAYCRVSTHAENQEDSFETQVAVYTKTIRNHTSWEYAGIYADRGFSGTDSERPQFRQMLEDALAGKIDLILCKSVSRFSRNVVDCRKILQLLSDNRIRVHFEEEGITTGDPAANLLLAFRAAVSQAESESISRSRLWANAMRVERGIYTPAVNSVIGYTVRDGKYVPDEKAPFVQYIFMAYLQGWTMSRIAHMLNMAGARTLRNHPFTCASVLVILSNEIYAGDRLLQKKPPKIMLEQYMDRQFPSRFLRDDHEAIVSRRIHEAVQEKLAGRRKRIAEGILTPVEDHHPLYGRLFCGICGAPLTRRTGTSGKKDGKPVHFKYWICRTRLKKQECLCPIKKEEELLSFCAYERIVISLDGISVS